MHKLTLALALLVPLTVHADDLTPNQEEAKHTFDEALAEPLAEMNHQCGTKATIAIDWKAFSSADWAGDGAQPHSLCRLVVNEIGYACKDRPAYRKAIGNELKGVNCALSGGSARQNKESETDWTRRNMGWKAGVFTYHMHKNHLNVEDGVKTTLEESVGKK